MKIFFTSYAILLLGITSANADLNESAEITAVTIDKVIKLEQAGKFTLALSSVQKIHKTNPQDVLIQLAYGRLLVKNSQVISAIRVLQPLATEHSKNWRPWFWLGSAYLLNGNLQKAGLSLDEALAREGQVVSIWVQRAIIEQEKGNAEAAVSLLQVANYIAPDKADVLLNYGYASELSGDLDKASAAYQRFLQISASKPEYGRVRSQVFQRISLLANSNKNPPDETE